MVLEQVYQTVVTVDFFFRLAGVMRMELEWFSLGATDEVLALLAWAVAC